VRVVGGARHVPIVSLRQRTPQRRRGAVTAHQRSCQYSLRSSGSIHVGLWSNRRFTADGQQRFVFVVQVGDTHARQSAFGVKTTITDDRACDNESVSLRNICERKFLSVHNDCYMRTK